MILAHKIQLDPTFKQVSYFRKACGTSRFTWNWGLAEWKKQYQAGQKPKGSSLKKQFNQIKYQQFPWMKEVHRDSHSQPFANLQKAFVSFFKHKSRYPQFKKKGVHDSFYVANDKLKVRGKKVRLPVLGEVRMTESLRFEGKIQGAVVSRTADRWFISLQVEVGDIQKDRISDKVVGIDLGLTNTVTCSDGQVFQAPKPLKTQLKKLQRASRSHSRKVKGSENRTKSARRLAKIHWKISSIRNDFLHKISTKVCRENQMVVIEDLSVRDMMKNRKLSRAISDVGWFEFRRQLEYKGKIFGTEIIKADRYYPSSKTCSICGFVKVSLTLSERAFRCESCGAEMDRDLNAARNLYTLGLREIYACGHRVRPVDMKAVMVEAGTNPCSHLNTI